MSRKDIFLHLFSSVNRKNTTIQLFNNSEVRILSSQPQVADIKVCKTAEVNKNLCRQTKWCFFEPSAVQPRRLICKMEQKMTRDVANGTFIFGKRNTPFTRLLQTLCSRRRLMCSQFTSRNSDFQWRSIVLLLVGGWKFGVWHQTSLTASLTHRKNLA